MVDTSQSFSTKKNNLLQ